jgi:flagellar biosynthetic protein FlhB
MADKGDGGGDAPDDSQKTEEPTNKRLDEARKQGQVPLSREANTWLMLFTATLVFLLAGPQLMTQIAGYGAGLMESSGRIRLQNATEAGDVFSDVASNVLRFMALPLILFVAAALFGTLVQIGFMISPDSIKPSLDKIDIMKGIQRVFSMKSFVEFLKGIMKLVLIGAVSYMILAPALPTIDQHVGQPLPLALEDMTELLRKLLTAILAALFLLALVDVIYVRLDFAKRMRMTRQEVRDEYKQTEGDPHVKARLRQLRTERARKRMIQAVPSADVVITNPTHYAVALKYDTGKMDAPVVVAKGVEAFALRIREVATEHKIPIVENPPLARSLFASVEVDEMIPENLYKAVAEVISYVFRLRGGAVRR